MPAGVATSTLTTFLGDIFGAGLNMILYILGVVWPYLMVIGIVFAFWRIGKAVFRV